MNKKNKENNYPRSSTAIYKQQQEADATAGAHAPSLRIVSGVPRMPPAVITSTPTMNETCVQKCLSDLYENFLCQFTKYSRLFLLFKWTNELLSIAYILRNNCFPFKKAVLFEELWISLKIHIPVKFSQ